MTALTKLSEGASMPCRLPACSMGSTRGSGLLGNPCGLCKQCVWAPTTGVGSQPGGVPSAPNTGCAPERT